MIKLFIKNIRKGLHHFLERSSDIYFQLFSGINTGNRNKTYYKCAGRNVFFGYNDRSPLSSFGDVVLAHRTLDSKWNFDSPMFPIEIGFFDYENGELFHPIVKSNAWSLQQGAMLQFLPGSFDRIMFNDFCGGSYLTRIYNLKGESIRDIPFAFYSISSDLNLITTIDFERLSYFRPGYGYNCRGHRGICLNDPIAYRVLNYSDCSTHREVLYEELGVLPHSIQFSYVNHLVFSKDNNYLSLFLVYQDQYDRRITCVIHDLINNTINRVNSDGMPSHFCWKSSNEFVLTIRDKRLAWSTNLYRILRNGEVAIESSLKGLTFDSHPVCTNAGKLIIDTAHASVFGKSELYEYSLELCKPKFLERFWSPSRFRGLLRSDLHHRLVRNEEELHLDVVKDGFRCSAILKLNDESSIY